MFSSTRTTTDFECNPSHHRHSGKKLFNFDFVTFITFQVVPQSSLTKSTHLTLHNVGYMLVRSSVDQWFLFAAVDEPSTTPFADEGWLSYFLFVNLILQTTRPRTTYSVGTW
jgi:hypothetical protein